LLVLNGLRTGSIIRNSTNLTQRLLPVSVRIAPFFATVATTMIGIVVSLVIAVLFAGIIRILVKNLLLRHEVRMVPGWEGLPIVGCTLEMKPDPVGE